MPVLTAGCFWRSVDAEEVHWMTKRVLTSNGKVIDLDKGTGIEQLPPESLAMEKHTYGSTTSFSIIFNGSVSDERMRSHSIC